MERVNSISEAELRKRPMPDTDMFEGPDMLEGARILVTRTLSEISSSTSPPRAHLPALFGRCLQLLPLLNAGDPTLADECCRVLLNSLGAILSGDPSPSLLPSLEVFAENLVSNRKSRSCLALVDLMLELVCRHFISSLENEGGFEVFWSALSWSGNESLGTPKISFQRALALFDMSCLFPLPTVVQAHLLLLVSRCISDPNLDSHLLAFEHAMNLYVRCLPALHIFNRIGGLNTRSQFVKEIPSCYCITDATDQKLRSKIYGLLLSCQLHSDVDLLSNESGIDRLIEEHQHILHEKFRQESSMVVKHILLNILHCAKQKDVLESDTEVSDEIICLAAGLRLMSSSLLHIQRASASDKENVEHATLRKVYSFIYECICLLLGQHEANGLHRYDLLDITGKPVDRKRASMPSMVMLAHFATMSLFCVRKRLGFLWKGCIVMLIMSVNLIAKEGGLGTFELFSKESAVVSSTEKGILKVSARVKATALLYEALHKMHKRKHSDRDGSSQKLSDVMQKRVIQRRAMQKSGLEAQPKK